MNARNWALLLALSLLWGSSFFFYKILVAAWPPVTVVLGRVGIAAIALNLWLAASGIRMPLTPALWGRFLVSGLLNNVLPFILIAWGETRISSGTASILNATTPIFTVVAAHLLTADEKLSGTKVAGVALGFLGTLVLVGPDALSGSGEVWGDLAVAAAACIYAFAAIYSRRLKGMPPMVAAAGQLSGGALILLPLSLAFDHPWTLPLPGWQVWAAILAIALMNTALAYVVYFRLLATAGVTYISLCTFIIPPVALLLGALFLGEAITVRALAGMAIIALGLAVNDGRALRWLRGAAPA